MSELLVRDVRVLYYSQCYFDSCFEWEILQVILQHGETGYIVKFLEYDVLSVVHG